MIMVAERPARASFDAGSGSAKAAAIAAHIENSFRLRRDELQQRFSFDIFVFRSIELSHRLLLAAAHEMYSP